MAARHRVDALLEMAKRYRLRFGSAGLRVAFAEDERDPFPFERPGAFAISRNRRCTVVSAVSSGWNAAAMMFPFCTSAGLPAYFGENFDAFADALDDRGADENHFERFRAAWSLPVTTSLCTWRP